ncbi:MAG: hypothetical protein SFU86_16300 [Pirellulaceae bacterium]|nr:hypothetical protein [Pirellulaceae bacterium]
MRIRMLLLVAAGIVVAVYGGYLWREARVARRTATTERHEDLAATMAALGRPVELAAGEVNLVKLAQLLGEQAGVAIDIDESSLQAEGIVSDQTIVHLPTGTLSLRSALRHLLTEADLGYEVRERRIVITTPDRAVACLVTQVHPLPQPGLASRRVDPGDWGELIFSQIEPVSWDDVGGPGHLEEVPGALVAVNTPDVHERIRRLLGELGRLDTPPAGFRPVPLLPDRTSALDRRIQAALAEPTEIDGREQTLEQVAADLSRRHGIPIFINRRGLRESGVSPFPLERISKPS